MCNTIFSNKKLFNLFDWKFDKVSSEEDEKGFKVTKLEVYNYIRYKDVDKLIKFLNTKQFNYCEDKSKYNSIFNIILGHNWKNIRKWKILKDYELSDWRYYKVLFIKVLNHRWSNFLLKIYWNASENKDFAKIEITYWIKKNNYNLFYWDWANKLKWIAEVINKINKKFEMIWFDEDFSWKINIKKKICKFLKKYDFNRRDKIIKILS